MIAEDTIAKAPIYCPACLNPIFFKNDIMTGNCINPDCPHPIDYILFHNLNDLIKHRGKCDSWFSKTLFEVNIDNNKKYYGYFFSNKPVEKYLAKKGIPIRSIYNDETLNIWIKGLENIAIPFSLFAIEYDDDCKFAGFRPIKSDIDKTNDNFFVHKTVQQMHEKILKFNKLEELKELLHKIKLIDQKEELLRNESNNIFNKLKINYLNMIGVGIPIIIHDVLVGICILWSKVIEDPILSNFIHSNNIKKNFTLSIEELEKYWKKSLVIFMKFSELGEQVYLNRRSSRDNLFREELFNRLNNIINDDIDNTNVFLSQIMNKCYSRICYYTLFDSLIILRGEPNNTISYFGSFPEATYKPLGSENTEFPINVEILLTCENDKAKILNLEKMLNITKINNLYSFWIERDSYSLLYLFINRKYAKGNDLNRLSFRTRSFIQSLSNMLQSGCELATMQTNRDEFLRDIAHNFRLPMLLLNTTLDKLELESFKGDISSNGIRAFIHQMDDIVSLLSFETKRFLTTQKLETIKTIENSIIKEINIIDLIIEIESAFTIIAKDNNIQFKPFKKDIVIFSVEEFISLIFEILLDNAVKYSEPNTFIEKIIRPQTMNNVDGFLVQISNFGIGIDENEKDRILKSRQRGKWATIHRPTAGTGRGLAILLKTLKKICGQFIGFESFFGGDINVKAGFGFKTTFSIWLPRKLK